MIKKVIFSILVMFLLGSENMHGQDPNYFVLGETELKNAEIYSIVQTKDKQLFVGTNDGLYYYQHGKMETIPNAPEQKGTSIFNLISNSKNEVFCSNLNGQIFKIEKNKLKLFFEVPEKYLGPYVEIEFDDNDRLILISKACMLIENNNYELIYFSEYKQGLALSKLPSNKVIATVSRHDTLFVFNNNKIKRVPFTRKNELTNPFQIMEFENEYYSSNNAKIAFTSNFVEKASYTYHQFQNNEVWRRSKSLGIQLIVKNNDSLKLRSYFKNTFISYIAKGEDDILFLGTFGEGLLVIPNLNTLNYGNVITNEGLQSIIATNDGSIFLSDRTDGIIHFKDSITYINTKNSYIPDRLFDLSKGNANLISEYPSLYYGRQGDYGAIKNVFEVDSSTFLIASSLGVSKQGEKDILKSDLWEQYNSSKNKNTYVLKNLNQRTNDVFYNEKKNELYVATISKFLKIDRNGKAEELFYNGESVIINDFQRYKGNLWCATQNKGILIFNGSKFSEEISATNGLGSSYIYRLDEKNGQFFISHKEGFQVFDISSKEWKTIGATEGIDKYSIKDFSINNGVLWLLSNDEVTSIPIDKIDTKSPTYDFKLDSIATGKRVLGFETTTLKYNQNNIRFFADFNGILYESEAIYEYQLHGFDKAPKKAPVTQKNIAYDYLPAGDYNFSIKVICRGESSAPIMYNFTIQQAFWETSWFYVLIFLLSTSAIMLFLYLRNRKIKKRGLELLQRQTLKTELVESELKSLRSQINPHFIFNSLNSIQDLILEKQTKASYDYIVLFSDLVRNALNYSNSSFISIDKEIEFLKTYLKLEELRFGDDFSYEINYNSSRKIRIPALLIQPFVENAVVHGLFHKDGNKKITVDFVLKNEQLQCIIKDNGVGRKEASEIKERQGNTSDSYALNAIAKRLKILSEKYSTSSRFEIDDVVEKNVISGTKATVMLPFLE